KDELIQLNEGTFWTGGPVRKNVNPGAYDNFMLARQEALKGNSAAANDLLKKVQGYYSESYLPLGDLKISQQYNSNAEPSAYYRDLDIANAIATTKFTIDGIEYTRQVISSAPDQVIVIRLTSSKPGQLNFNVSTNSVVRFRNEVISSSEIAMKGKAPAHVEPNYEHVTGDPITWDDPAGERGMRFDLRVKAINK